MPKLIFPDLMQCRACDLRKSSFQVVPGFGNPDSDVLFVAQSPGKEEALKGQPLIGKSGKLFTEMVAEAGYNINDFAKTNINKCQPPNNRPATAKEMIACDPWLRKELMKIRPTVIVAMGDSAYKAFLPLEESSITQIQGNVFERIMYPDGTIELENRDLEEHWVDEDSLFDQPKKVFIIPVVHPAFVLRNQLANRSRFVDHIRLAMQISEEGRYEAPTRNFRKSAATWEEVMEVVNSPDDFGFDLETDTGSGDDVYENDSGLRGARIIGVGVCNVPGDGRYYPFESDEEAQLKMAELKPALEDPEHTVIVSNAKFERHVCSTSEYEITVRGYHDTMTQSWILGDTPLSLKDAIHHTFGIEMIRINKFKDMGYKQTDQHGKTNVDLRAAQDDVTELVVEYAAQDADASLRLHQHQMPILEERGMLDLYELMELPFTEAIIDMEDNGIAFDVEALLPAKKDAYEALEHYTTILRALVGDDLNVNAYMRVRQALWFPTDPYYMKDPEEWDQARKDSQYKADVAEQKRGEDKGLKNIKMAPPIFKAHSYTLPFPMRYREGDPTSLSLLKTDAVFLAEYNNNPLVRAMITLRAVRKLISQYIEGLPEWVESDGRIHSEIRQTSASTGRTTSRNPNVQNISNRKREDIDFDFEGSRIRQAFTVPAGKVLCCPDLSQIEMRIVAHLSNDEAMIRELTEGDIHANTTRGIYGTTEEEVNDPKVWKNMRFLAKTVGFGVLYGLTPIGLVKRTPSLALSPAEAEDFIQGFYNTYPNLKTWQDSIIRSTRRLGYAETISSRRRYLPDITASEPSVRSEAERQAINVPVQGSAADFFKVATNNVRAFLIEQGSKTILIGQVHDELMMEAPEEELDFLLEHIPGIMGSAYKLSVPVPVDFEYGPNWGNVKTREQWEKEAA